MEMENSSSRSPDSSCPDYFSCASSLGGINRDQSSDSLDLISSSTGNSVSSSFGSHFQNNLGNNRNGLIPENLSKRPDHENNGRSVISFAAVGRNEDDRLKSTPENSSRGQNYLYGGGSVLNPPAVENQWLGSSSVTSNSCGLSSVNYQNSLFRNTGNPIFYKTTAEQVCSSRNPPSYSKTEMPYFASTSNMLRVPKTELSPESSSVSNPTNFLSVVPSTTSASSAKQQRKTLPSSQTIAILKAAAAGYIPQQHTSPYNFMAQNPETSAISSENGYKRKSSPALNNSDYLSSASSSSSSSSVDREQNVTNPSKKSKAHGSSPSYVELEDTDDDIQILTPVTSKSHTSSASSSSWSRANYHKASVISDGGSTSSLNTSKPSEGATLLDSHSSNQTIQEGSSAIHKPLSPEELDQMLESVWSDLDEITSAANVTSAVAPETVTLETLSDGDNSSSSSIVSIHEVQRATNSFEKGSKQQSPKLEKVSTDVPEIIALDESPRNDESQELKAFQEVENVKEDFKKLIEDELICNICTEVLIKPITLGCSHTFCKFCIAQWKEKKNQCPMCRAPITTETPCLFLHNFISKAVEQLDPASVEKRTEIIQTREELQKNKICKPSPGLTQPLSGYQLLTAPHATTINTVNALQNFPSFPPLYTSHSVSSNVATRITIPNVVRLTTNINQRPLSHRRDIDIHITGRVGRSSDLPHQSSSMPQRSLNLTQPSSTVSQPTSIVPQPTSIVPQPTLGIPRISSNIPLNQYPHLLQPSNGSMDGFFFWNR